MGSQHDDNGNTDNFSFATKELKRAQSSRELKLAGAPAKSSAKSAGFDPYNTSGSFDRKKHWERVGKR